MRTRVLLLTVLVGLAVVLLGIYGCTKKENPLQANPDESNTAEAMNLATVASITPAPGGHLGNLNGKVEIVFDDFMDESTVRASNITVLNTTTNTELTNLEVSYDPLHRLAFVSVPEWSDSAAFLLTMTTGVENLAGMPIDFDGDNVEDGSPYDNYLSTFYTGNGSGALARRFPPTISGHIPGIDGNISLTTMFTINFNSGLTAMDSTTLVIANFHLTKTATQTPITIERDAFGGNWVRFRLPAGSQLAYGTRYTFTVDGGEEVKAFPDTTGEDNYLLILDTDGDGPEENEPDYCWDFVTVDTTGSSQGSPPQVTSVSAITEGLAISFGLVPDERMDMTTFTAENIRAFDDMDHIPGTFHNDPDSLGLRYFFDRATSGAVHLFVSMQVKDVDGNLLDGNANGVGGEPGLDDYWWP